MVFCATRIQGQSVGCFRIRLEVQVLNSFFNVSFLIAFCGETTFCLAGNSRLSYCHPTEIVSTLAFLYIIVQAGFSIEIAIFERGGQRNSAELTSQELDYPILIIGRVTISRKLLS